MEPCPYCDEPMLSGDSGEPYNMPGWWCTNCDEFFSDDELAEYYDQLNRDRAEAIEDENDPHGIAARNRLHATDDGYGGPPPAEEG